MIVVVCHLHGQISRITFWANGKRNPCVDDPFIFCTKSVLFTEKRLRKRENGIKGTCKKNENEFLFGTFRLAKRDYLVRRSIAPENFPLKRPSEPIILQGSDQ